MLLVFYSVCVGGRGAAAAAVLRMCLFSSTWELGRAVLQLDWIVEHSCHERLLGLRAVVAGHLCFPSFHQVNGVVLHCAEHHVAVEALRGSGSTVSMLVLRERMVEPENAITVTPLRPEDDSTPRERRGSRLADRTEGASPPERLYTCLTRNDRGLGFSIAGGQGSTPYRPGDPVRRAPAGVGWGEEAVAPLRGAPAAADLQSGRGLLGSTWVVVGRRRL